MPTTPPQPTSAAPRRPSARLRVRAPHLLATFVTALLCGGIATGCVSDDDRPSSPAWAVASNRMNNAENDFEGLRRRQRRAEERSEQYRPLVLEVETSLRELQAYVARARDAIKAAEAKKAELETAAESAQAAAEEVGKLRDAAEAERAAAEAAREKAAGAKRELEAETATAESSLGALRERRDQFVREQEVLGKEVERLEKSIVDLRSRATALGRRNGQIQAGLAELLKAIEDEPEVESDAGSGSGG